MRLQSQIESISRRYSKGIITKLEAVSILLQVLDGNVPREIMEQLPQDVLDGLEDYAKHAPRTDEEWKAAVFISIRGAIPRDGLDAEPDESKLRLRAVVERLRECFGWK